MVPMPQIEMALEGKAAYLRALNGVPEPKPDKPVMKPADGPDGLMAFLRRRKEG